ncbi:ROK family protein [Agromyces bracchium]|uniref:ROK family protein n=1 Tax=Agromyces bracchium TaxID=88376 RepID=A0A6I3M987_9MICO|nr:ROK family protein [Agromyces bracchium]MTH70019.1 ROK family protein [Agromyces bracchium]
MVDLLADVVVSDESSSAIRIVKLVRSGAATTRPELGRLTGLGRSVVAQRVDRAIELGFLEELEGVSATAGRAPRRLRFRSERGLLVTCALGALHIHVGVASLDGDVLAHDHREWDITRGPELTLAAAFEMIAGLLEQVDDVPLWAIAVGVPGPVRFATGRPVSSPMMPGWNGYDIRGRFEERFDAPTWVDKDVNLLAVRERARERKPLDLIYCKIGTGLGAGLLSEGKVHRGAGGAAGDIGHVRVVDEDIPCRCGKTGCLEAVASGWAIVRDARRAVDDGAEGLLVDRLADGAELSPELVAIAADDGDALALSLMQRSARLVGGSIATLVNVFNPSVIVIGGVVAGAGQVFLAEVRRRVYELSLPVATQDLTIIRSADDPREPLRGGMELAREQLFGATFARWFLDGAPSVARCTASRIVEASEY